MRGLDVISRIWELNAIGSQRFKIIEVEIFFSSREKKERAEIFQSAALEERRGIVDHPPIGIRDGCESADGGSIAQQGLIPACWDVSKLG